MNEPEPHTIEEWAEGCRAHRQKGIVSNFPAPEGLLCFECARAYARQIGQRELERQAVLCGERASHYKTKAKAYPERESWYRARWVEAQEIAAILRAQTVETPSRIVEENKTPHSPEEWAAEIFGVNAAHIRDAPAYCGDGEGGSCLRGDCEIVQAVEKLRIFAAQEVAGFKELLERIRCAEDPDQYLDDIHAVLGPEPIPAPGGDSRKGEQGAKQDAARLEELEKTVAALKTDLGPLTALAKAVEAFCMAGVEKVPNPYIPRRLEEEYVRLLDALLHPAVQARVKT